MRLLLSEKLLCHAERHAQARVDGLQSRVVEEGEPCQAEDGVPDVRHVFWPVCDASLVRVLRKVGMSEQTSES